jgi:hypothetical protein
MGFKQWIYNIWRNITEFFDKQVHPQDHTPIVIEDNHRVDIDDDVLVDGIEPPKGKVAFVVGHNSGAQGAWNYLKESEWSFNSRIAKKCQAKMKKAGYQAYVIFRPPGKRYSSQVWAVKEEAKKLSVTHAFCLHFNSASAGARGCEFLIPQSASDIDNKMADMGTDLLNERMGIIERREDGVFEVSPSHNGSGMLMALRDAGIHAVLPEPCFANYRTKESAAIFENEDAYVDILVEVALACATGKISEYNKD